MKSRNDNYRKCDTYKAIRRNKSYMNNMAFGDEGGVYACMDYEVELYAECEDCDIVGCPYKEVE